MTTVSVAMPVRNAAATVETAVASLQAQDLGDIEIVVVDHGSTDATPDILARLARTDPRLRVLRHEGSFVEAANLSWRSTSGDYVARMDADDIARPNRLSRQRDLLVEQPALAGCASLVRILRRGPDGASQLPPEGGYRRYETWINSLVEPEEIAAQRFIDSPLPNPATMLRRTVLEAAGGYADPPWAEDYDLWLRLIADGHRFAKVPETLLDWFDGEHRATRKIERYSLARFQEAKACYLAKIPKVAEVGAIICGAGPTGKDMAARLRRRGVAVQAFLEVNPRQIGERIGGVPVLDSDRAADFRGRAAMLAAVGRQPGRSRIRNLLSEAGFQEGEDFFCVA